MIPQLCFSCPSTPWTFPPAHICSWCKPSWKTWASSALPKGLHYPAKVPSMATCRQPTEDTRHHMLSEGGCKSLNFVSFTPTQTPLNRHLAGRAQMWQCSHGNLGRSLSRIISQRVCILICSPLSCPLVPFRLCTIYGTAKIPLEQAIGRCSSDVTVLEFGCVERNSKWKSHCQGLWQFPLEWNLLCNFINRNKICLVWRGPAEWNDKHLGENCN